MERYHEPEEDETAPWKEQEGWEASLLAKASQKYGAKDKARNKAEDYEFVFEDQIDFIKDEYLAGEGLTVASLVAAKRFNRGNL